MMGLRVAAILWFVTFAYASTIVGNPTVKLPDWYGSALSGAPLPAPLFVFEGVGGGVVERTGPSCDLAVGCSVVAPMYEWTRVTLVVPEGVTFTTAGGSVQTEGGVLRFEAVGEPSATDGPDAIALEAASMALD